MLVVLSPSPLLELCSEIELAEEGRERGGGTGAGEIV